jgi:hypothetical protein
MADSLTEEQLPASRQDGAPFPLLKQISAVHANCSQYLELLAMLEHLCYDPGPYEEII